VSWNFREVCTNAKEQSVLCATVHTAKSSSAKRYNARYCTVPVCYQCTAPCLLTVLVPTTRNAATRPGRRIRSTGTRVPLPVRYPARRSTGLDRTTDLLLVVVVAVVVLPPRLVRLVLLPAAPAAATKRSYRGSPYPSPSRRCSTNPRRGRR